MDDLIANISNNVGIDAATARKAVGIILNFIAKDGPQDLVNQALDEMPGARELMAEEGGGDGGLLGGIVGTMGAMGALTQLTSLGLDMGQVTGVTGEVIDYAKERAGEDVVDDIVGSIPGLNQVV